MLCIIDEKRKHIHYERWKLCIRNFMVRASFITELFNFIVPLRRPMWRINIVEEFQDFMEDVTSGDSIHC